MLLHHLNLLPLAVLIALSGCKVVKNDSENSASSTNPDAYIGDLVENSFASQLLPFVSDTAISVSDLRSAVDADLEAAGAAHGNRGAGIGSAWNFAVQGQGTVITSKMASKARKVHLDTDGDGVADVTLQLGPVIKGTVLRDIAPFYNFGDFRDQIEFAKLARALNDKNSGSIPLFEGDLIGEEISFLAAVALKSSADKWLLTAVELKVQP